MGIKGAMMAVSSKVDFFVSYNSADESWAEWITWTLEEAGYTTVMQSWDFRPGGNFVMEMQRALEYAERLVAVLSDEFLAASFTQPEWAAVFAADPQGLRRALVPVMVRQCQPAGLLSTIIHIKVYGMDENSARNRLIDGVRPGRVKPGHRPSFPGTATITP
ncbi:toll/interleukin-1 receptor domain-containing protein [Streptacidiphilus sp. N1-12]|uniref:Toll/interleukin-1 receptor domain-containing protein n=2 Tax=Streptacidiphilus alkalitolerans TaxID=3342712 RepID=A0ABV6WIU7_9ACTN